MLNYTVNIICKGLLLISFSIMTKKWLLLKNLPISRLEYKNYTLFLIKMAEKPYPLGPHIPIQPILREYTRAHEGTTVSRLVPSPLKSLHEVTGRRDLSHEQFTQSVLRTSRKDLSQKFKLL